MDRTHVGLIILIIKKYAMPMCTRNCTLQFSLYKIIVTLLQVIIDYGHALSYTLVHMQVWLAKNRILLSERMLAGDSRRSHKWWLCSLILGLLRDAYEIRYTIQPKLKLYYSFTLFEYISSPEAGSLVPFISFWALFRQTK